MNDAIVKRLYFAVKLKLDSPLCVSGGESIQTDMDVMRNGSGEPFIPGSSVAGAFRNYLETPKERDLLMGFTDPPGEENNGKMSALFFSDLYFEENSTTIGVRDGILLGEDKIVVKEKKYEQEMIETGAETILYLECAIRKNQEAVDYEKMIKRLLLAAHEGEIRFGSRKNRGFGKMLVMAIYRSEFDANMADAWLDFQKDPRNVRAYQEKYQLEEWAVDVKEEWERQYLFLIVPLRLTGGISIRRYSSHPDLADFEHVTCNGMPVIPGSSWNGVIRETAREILEELGYGSIDSLLKRWFGFVEKKKAEQSLVVVSESVLLGAQALPMTRNRIDRFDASSKNGGLYSELSYFKGTTSLRIGVRKKKEYQALTGLMLMVIEEIQTGYAAVGGQTAVGRGIFQENGEIEIENGEDSLDYKKALFELLAKEDLRCNSVS